jgi:hypothetical protein
MVREWCAALAMGAEREIGFDGFARPSFVKGREGLSQRYQLQLGSVDEYARFITQYVERQPNRRNDML